MSMRQNYVVGTLLIWLMLFCLTVWFDDEVRVALWLGAEIWWLLLDLAGNMLILILGFLGFRRPRGQRSWPVIAALIPAGVLAAWHLAGDHWVHVARFQLNRGHYERRLAQIQTVAIGRLADHLAADCLFDSGPPLRVAFQLPGDILDNFIAIVHDPTGAVLRVNAIRDDPALRQDSNLTRIRLLFGGDLVSTEHQGGPWYRCVFT